MSQLRPIGAGLCLVAIFGRLSPLCAQVSRTRPAGNPDSSNLVAELNSRLKDAKSRALQRGPKGRKQSKALEPPALETFIDYGISKGISEQDCRDQFAIWEAGTWKDGNNTPIQNWKQKILTFQKIGNLLSHKKANIVEKLSGF